MRKSFSIATIFAVIVMLFGCMGGSYKQTFKGSFFEIGYPDNFTPKNTAEGLYLEGPFKILISSKLCNDCKQSDTNSVMVVANEYGKDFWASQQVFFGHPAVMLRLLTDKGILMGCYIPFDGVYAYAKTVEPIEDEKIAENIFGSFDVTNGEDVLLYATEIEKNSKGSVEQLQNSKVNSEQINSVLEDLLEKQLPTTIKIDTLNEDLEKGRRQLDLKKELERKDTGR